MDANCEKSKKKNIRSPFHIVYIFRKADPFNQYKGLQKSQALILLSRKKKHTQPCHHISSTYSIEHSHILTAYISKNKVSWYNMPRYVSRK